jgi:hypothetical protein
MTLVSFVHDHAALKLSSFLSQRPTSHWQALFSTTAALLKESAVQRLKAAAPKLHSFRARTDMVDMFISEETDYGSSTLHVKSIATLDSLMRRIHICTCAHICTSVHTHVCTHMHIHVHTCTFMYTHAHTFI